MHTLDDHNIDTTVREAAIFELCERLQPGIVQDVVIPYCMTDWGGCVIQVKKRNRIDEGWQRNFMAALSAPRACARHRGQRRLDPYDGRHHLEPHDPGQSANRHPQSATGRARPNLHAGRTDDRRRKQWTASNTHFEGGMGIDATVPFGYESDFLRPVYPVDRIELEKLFTKKDIENAKSRMQGWVHSLARTGR